jgi:hypothetical protein
MFMTLGRNVVLGLSYGQDGGSNWCNLTLVARRIVQGCVDLGAVTGTQIRDNLTLDSAADVDWYKFTLTHTGTAGQKVQLDFLNTEGDLALAVYAADETTLVGQSDGTTNTEQVSLAGLASGDYYVKIWSTHQDVSRKYKLTVVA